MVSIIDTIDIDTTVYVTQDHTKVVNLKLQHLALEKSSGSTIRGKLPQPEASYHVLTKQCF